MYELFNSRSQGTQSPQGNQGPQGQAIFTTNSPQGEFSSTNDQVKSSIISATAISKIQLDSVSKNSLHSSPQNESPYSEVLLELSGGVKQVIKNNVIFERMNGFLVIHYQSQDTDLDFWGIIFPDNDQIKEQIVQEVHSTPYSTHPRIQRTIAKVRRSFYWKGML